MDSQQPEIVLSSVFLPHTPLDEMKYDVKAPSYCPSPTRELKERAVVFVGSAGQGNLAIVQRIFELYPEIVSVYSFIQSCLIYVSTDFFFASLFDFKCKNTAPEVV